MSCAESMPKVEPLLRAEGLNFAYAKIRPDEQGVLDHVNCELFAGDMIALVGASGSGKSTLLRHLNGLLRADRGELYWQGQPVYHKKFKMLTLRQNVGLVFQDPEKQFLAQTVFRDVVLGPLNLGLSQTEAELRAREALSGVGLTEAFWQRNPFECSGGEQRKIALAAVLAMRPKVLLLDEPVVGLDAATKRELFTLLHRIRAERACAVLFISHDLDDVARYASQVWLMESGRLSIQEDPRDFFESRAALAACALRLPEVVELGLCLRERHLPLPEGPLMPAEAEEILFKICSKKGH